MKRLTSLVAFLLALAVLFCACGTTPAETTGDPITTDNGTTVPTTTEAPDTTTEAPATETTTDAPVTTTTKAPETTTVPEPVIPEIEKKSLKVLAIGNSFSEDATKHLWDICDAAGIEDVVIANLYIGGCTLDTHWENMKGDKAAYQYQFNDFGVITKSTRSIRYALEHQDWDIITIQQVSQDSGRPETFKNLQNILNYINQYKKNPDAKIYWHMTWAYQSGSTHSGFANYGKDQMTMYNAIVSATQGILNDYEEIAGVIPSGTAVQNLRTSFLGDTITRDGYHMSWATGRYITALTWFHTFTGYPVEYVDWYPDFIESGIDYRFDPKNLDAVREAVTNAVAEPFKVTESAYAPVTEPTKTTALTAADRKTLSDAGFNPDQYAVLDLELTVHAFYNSGSNSTLTTSENSTATNVPNFNASRLFVKKDIPNGSVIWVGEGYQYRPEGWTNLSAKTSPRPENVKRTITVVDAEWWGSYQHRAFNLSAITTKTMTAEDNANLRVYVPTVANPTIPEQAEGPKTALVSGDQKKADFEVLAALGTVSSASKASDYTLLDWKPTVASYYNSSSNSQRVSAANSSASNIPNFISSDMFTPADLPEGTIIIVDSGYQYRPEGWTNLSAKTSPRPDNVTENVVVVSAGWWGSYKHRAFSLSATVTKTMTAADAAHLRIYVPTK
ncbi:MAG: DUF4886 domain-containing protein [Clostridia bacterium]|nr:DUF4886 domain-containing protein [Clostridia bacterium]